MPARLLRSTAGRLSAGIALVVATFTVASTTPADAAGSSAPDLRVCLNYSTGATYASKPLYLYVWNGSSWVYANRSGSSNGSGCATFTDVGANRYYTVQGYWTYTVGSAAYAWSGYTGSALTGSGSDQVTIAPTGTVYQYRLY